MLATYVRRKFRELYKSHLSNMKSLALCIEFIIIITIKLLPNFYTDHLIHLWKIGFNIAKSYNL